MKHTAIAISLALSALNITAHAAPEIDQLIRQAKSDKGYQLLFTADLSNAILTENMWQFKDGVLEPTPERVKSPAPVPAAEKGKKGKKAKAPKLPSDIWSTARYGNSIVDLEFKCEEDTNSGVFIRCDDPVQWLHTGIEIQILQGSEGAKTPRNDSGAIYDCKGTDILTTLKPAGEWNKYTIIAKDNWIHVLLNGELINSMDLDLWTEAGKNPDGSKNKFKTAYKDMAREGHIGLQYHGHPVWFRNVRVKAL